jgi:hypothetical protein
MEVMVKSLGTTGPQFAHFIIEIENGMPLAFKLEAEFTGPTVSILEPLIDFGLTKINSSHKFRLNIENTSPVETRILVKNSKNKRLSIKDFDQSISSDQGLRKSTTKTFKEQPN